MKKEITWGGASLLIPGEKRWRVNSKDQQKDPKNYFFFVIHTQKVTHTHGGGGKKLNKNTENGQTAFLNPIGHFPIQHYTHKYA